MRGAATALVVVAIAACESREPITSCSQNLHGVWVTPAGAKWMVLDNGPTLEVFPLFDDLVPEGAPRVIDVTRGPKNEGNLKRRFMRRDIACEARAPVTLTSCSNDSLQFVIGEVSAPLSFEPCSWPQQAPSRVEVWRRD